MSKNLQAVLLTAPEIEALLETLRRRGDESLAGAVHALRNPIPDLAAYQDDIRELVSRARDASSYIDEDFPDFLAELKGVRQPYAAAVEGR